MALSPKSGPGTAAKNGMEAGQKASNIYDYTYALDGAKIGQPVDIVVMRDGQRPISS